MQQLGPNAASCMELAQRLVEDFIVYPKVCCEQLKSLPMVAPRSVHQRFSITHYMNESCQIRT